MYSFDSRIRYSETDSEGRLTLEALLDYFQDCSTFQSEDLGVGLRYLAEKNAAWVLSSWQVVIDRLPDLCEQVTIGTFPYAFKGCFGNRNFFLKDKEGLFLAKANTLWTYLDTETFKPLRLSDEIVSRYPMEEKLSMNYAGRKIEVPQDGSFTKDIVVMPWHLDTNHHVNNVQYVRMALSMLTDRFPVARMRAEYKKQAFLDDVLHPYVANKKGDEGQDIWVVSLQDGCGGVYANVEFEGAKE